MEKDILSVLSASAGFSKGQKRIAGYILDNYDRAAFMTAGRLGAAVGVSESTVVRFAAELGYDGYPEMRKALQDMVRNRLTSVQRIEVAKELLENEDVIHSVLSTDIEELETTLEEVDKESFAKAVDAIVNARNVYILGMRTSNCLANFLGFYLNLLMDNVRVVQDTTVSEVYEQIVRIGEGDVFIGISYPRYSSRSVRAMQFAKVSGATVIGITDSETSPLCEMSDSVLLAKSDMVSFLDSLVAPMSLINALIVAVGSKTQASRTFDRLEKIWRDYDVYESPQK